MLLTIVLYIIKFIENKLKSRPLLQFCKLWEK